MGELGRCPVLVALACVLLAGKGDNVWLADSAAGAAANGTWSGINPTQYTVGGVLSGAAGIERHFTQILSVSLLTLAVSRSRTTVPDSVTLSLVLVTNNF